MALLPLLSDLPAIIQTTGWAWEPFEAPDHPSHDFWIGTDGFGHRWLTKLRGSFYGYRELVFERLAQRLGWSCQSSAFAVLDENALPIRLRLAAEHTQLLSWLLPEHRPHSCGPNCPYDPLRLRLKAQTGDPLELIEGSGLRDFIAWPLSQILAPLLGGNEPAGYLITIDHQVVMIDGEQMFSTSPSDVRETNWWQLRDGSPSRAGQRLTKEACAAVAALSDADLQVCLEIPKGIEIRFLWNIRKLLFEARDYARAFAALHRWPI